MNVKKIIKKILPKPILSIIRNSKKSRADYYIQKILHQHFNTNEKIKVGFLVQMPEIWSKQEQVYQTMLTDDRFEPVLIIIPKFDFSKGIIGSYGPELDYFISRCPNKNYIIARKNKTWAELRNEHFEYIFYQRPYDEYLPVCYRSRTLVKYTKICYIPYATHDIRNTKIYPFEFFKNIYFGFMDDEEGARLNNKYYAHKAHISFYNIGYPSFERCLRLSRKCDYKNVLWTPRWSYDKVSGGSHFFEYEPYLTKFDWKEQSFMIRPHPLMWDNFIKTGKITAHQADKICEQWAEHKITIDTNMDIEKTFEHTDILISDISSIMLMFFLTGKPIVYCVFDVELGPLWDSIMPGIYIARNWDDVEKYIRMFQEKNDPLANVRQEIIQKRFAQHKNVAEKIINVIADDHQK